MSRTTRAPTKQIAINIPLPLLSDIDLAASALKICRTHMILRCLRRDLNAVLQHEVRRAQAHTAALEKEFGKW